MKTQDSRQFQNGAQCRLKYPKGYPLYISMLGGPAGRRSRPFEGESSLARISTFRTLRASDSTLKKLRAAAEAAGMVFVDPNGAGTGVRLKGK